MQKVVSFVKVSFAKRPVVTNSIIYGSLYVAAEVSQQILSKKVLAKTNDPIDTKIIGRYALISTTAMGPALTKWYQWLDGKFAGTALRIVGKKLLIDQFCFTPCLLVFFYTSMSALEGKSDLLEECRNKFVPTFKASCLFWLPVQGINFLLLPPAFRVVYVGCCSFAWINILCWFKRQ